MKYREIRKTIFTLAFSLCLYQTAVAQDKTIELPQTEGFEFKSKGKHVNPFFRIYINKKKEVYFEKIKLDSMIQLVDTINKYRSQLRAEEAVFVNFFLYADRNLPYATIDSVRSILGSIYVGRLFSMTNNIEERNSGFGRRIYASLTYRKVQRSGSDELYEISREDMKNDKMEEQPIGAMIEELYTLNFDEGKKLASRMQYKHVRFVNDEFMLINNQKVALSDDEAIYEHIKDLDFYFLYNSPTMSYGDYVKNWIAILNTLRKYDIHNPSIDISNGLEKILVRENIKL